MGKIFLMIFGVILLSSPVFAAGTCVESLTRISPGVSILQFTCTGDAADGTFPATVSSRNIEGYVFMVLTNPGSPALTDNYDISLVDTDGLDISGGLLVNRDQAVTEVVIPKVDLVASLYGPRYVKGKVTLEISNNSVLSGVVAVSLYIAQ